MENFNSEYTITYLQFFTDQHEYEIKALINFYDSIVGDYNEEFSSLNITYQIEFLIYVDGIEEKSIWIDYANNPVYYNSGDFQLVNTESNGVAYLDIPDLDPAPYLLNYGATINKEDQEIYFIIFKDGNVRGEQTLLGNDESDGISGTHKDNSNEFARILIDYYWEQPFHEWKDAALYFASYDEGYEDGYYQGNEDGFENGYFFGTEDGFENGLNEGYDIGYDSGHRSGYNEGYDVGINEGYQQGYEDGEINRPLTTFGTVIKVISDNASNLLNTEILPNFTISNIIFIPVIFSLLGIVFKFFRR